MNNIPFPNPHDADALNEFLDTRASGRDIDPEDAVQAAALEFHRLAASARFEKGPRDMRTATLTVPTAPVSNRTRRQVLARQTSSRWNTWTSTALVAALLLSVIGYGMWNGPGRDDNNLAWAPQTASPMSDEPLNPETSPWIADFSVEDCRLQGTQNYDLPSSATVRAEPQDYAVTGPASEDDALAVADAYRDMRGCRNMDGAFNYWSRARIENAPRVLNDENRLGLTDLEGYFRTVYPDQFMAVATGLQVEPRLQDEWDLRNDYGITGLPIPLAAKLNPKWGVELSDGRVAFPATIMYAANDPAIVANGLPVDKPDSTVAMVFTFEDGAWKYDDSLLLCIVNCDYGVGSPVDPAEAPWARPADPEACNVEPITSDEYRERLSDFPSYTNRSYNIAGNPTEEDATEAARSGQSLLDCSLAGRAFVVEALLTDLGLHHYRFTQQATVPRSAELAGYLRQRDVGGRNLMLTSDYIIRIAVVDGPITPYMPDGRTSEPIPFDLTSYQNVASTHSPEYTFDPTAAILLGDGRIAFGATQLIALDSRAAVTYEGDAWLWYAGWTVLQETDEGWRVDELLYTHRNFLVAEANRNWWWEPQYNATPVASPQLASPMAEEPLIWTAPISPRECPEDQVIPRYDPDNPSGVLYSQEDYDEVSSERDYEITGPADPKDATAVVGRMRQVQACAVYARQLPWWSVRYEYETRTSAGRASLESVAGQRASAEAIVRAWYEDEMALMPSDMVVYQNPNELSLDGSEALVTQGLYNPAYAVQFADGRVGIIHSVVTYEPVEHEIAPYYAPNMSIFVLQDGQWMFDESLPICFGECEAMATPVIPAGDIAYPFSTPIATPKG